MLHSLQKGKAAGKVAFKVDENAVFGKGCVLCSGVFNAGEIDICGVCKGVKLV